MCALKKNFFTVHFMDMRKVLCYVEFLFIANMWFATFIKVGGMQQGESQGGVRAELANTCACTHA